ncbi:hypothetical protein RRF57_009384 [Xylaria bambusicola]|uniref:Uncharacterized protein n=1 Tax=Xylaria bambusicola TaxID=326684 RepID=A0AAN7UJJ3_9PEZI
MAAGDRLIPLECRGLTDCEVSDDPGGYPIENNDSYGDLGGYSDLALDEYVEIHQQDTDFRERHPGHINELCRCLDLKKVPNRLGVIE